ncbi:MAG: chemotaxis protein CheW [Proteobacteria bacterium]|nr:chemotaxis protein CheW [Pseudomonadota bacterium]
MSNAIAERLPTDLVTHPGQSLEEFVTFLIADQLFGVPVRRVQDILQPQRIASIPLAPPAVRGSINLRGRIVTVIDVRVRLGLKPIDFEKGKSIGVTVERGPDLYTLLVDGIGDVIGLTNELHEKTPRTLDPKWREYSTGIYRLKDRLLIILDIDRLLDISYEPKAA